MLLLFCNAFALITNNKHKRGYYMLTSKYQRVGALAGLLMFLGSWLTAFYGNWIWATLTILLTVFALWTALEDGVAEELTARVTKGLIAGLIAGVVARVLGLLTMAWSFDSWTAQVNTDYSSLNDVFRIFFNGNVVSSLVAIVGMSLLGGFIAYALPYFAAEKEEE